MLLLLGEDWTLAGLGAALMGVGSALTGWAALRAARKPKEENHEDPVEGDAPAHQ
jgi:hypothetical protein